jgi:hypothetical protein
MHSPLARVWGGAGRRLPFSHSPLSSPSPVAARAAARRGAATKAALRATAGRVGLATEPDAGRAVTELVRRQDSIGG